MLTQKLRELERDGFIKREMFSEMPVRVEYSLTALGGKLRLVLRVLDAWSRKYVVEKEPSLTRVTKRLRESNPGTLPNYDGVVAIALIISVRSLSEIKVNTSA
jgi:DNA-binding PadR family transcriptional regulator